MGQLTNLEMDGLFHGKSSYKMDDFAAPPWIGNLHIPAKKIRI